MKSRRTSIVSLVWGLALVCLICVAPCSPVWGAAAIPAVTGPLPVTPDSYPFGAADRTVVPQDLTKVGYVEQEYLVAGLANIYDLDADGVVLVKTPDAPYTTRILVRRPASPKKFSGTVIVELLNPTAGYDLDLQWQFCRDYFVEHGDAWIGITSKPVAIKALKVFDPERYHALSWANPLPSDRTCATPNSLLPDSTPETENGLVWDILSQVGALTKSDLPQNPMRGYPVKRAYATGYSQTGGYMVTYVNFIRPLPNAALSGGRPVFDGYLIGDGDGLFIPLNQCSERIYPGDRRFVITARPEPVISLSSQTLVGINMQARRPDSDTPEDRYRRYEVPGAAHVNQRGANLSPRFEDVKKALGAAPPIPACKELKKYGLTEFPFEYFMDGAFANLEAWVASGKVPPKAPLMATKSVPGVPFAVADVDDHGNAVGGVRSPYLDVPSSTFFTSSTPTDQKSGFFCSLCGYEVPFPKETLVKLYPTHRDYVKKVAEEVDAMVKGKFITASDGARIKAEAARAAVP